MMAQSLMATVGERRTGPHAGGIRQKYILDERGRRLILENYDGKTSTIDRLARQLGVPRWRVKRWASEMGLAYNLRAKPWTDEELTFLERHLSHMGITAMAKHLNRSKIAIKLKAKRIGVAKSDDGYTMRRLCDCLGCDHHKVKRWVSAGWLKGTRRQSERVDEQGGDMWLFTDAQVRNFIVRHPEEIDPRRVGWLWVVDLLSGGLGPLGKD